MKNKDLSCLWGAIFAILGFLLMFFAAILQGNAQNVTRKGNVFVQDSTSHQFKKKDVTLTKYYYMSTDGTKYPIYMSSTGKCFIIRTSSKTGKQYRQYLPEVTKQLQQR